MRSHSSARCISESTQVRDYIGWNSKDYVWWRPSYRELATGKGGKLYVKAKICNVITCVMSKKFINHVWNMMSFSNQIDLLYSSYCSFNKSAAQVLTIPVHATEKSMFILLFLNLIVSIILGKAGVKELNSHIPSLPLDSLHLCLPPCLTFPISPLPHCHLSSGSLCESLLSTIPHPSIFLKHT